MFPGCGKYLAFQSCERATEGRNERCSRHCAVETEQIPEPDVRGAVWTVVCECVCAAPCVCEAWTAQHMEAHFEHQYFHSVTQLCEKHSGAPSEAYRGVLSRHTDASSVSLWVVEEEISEAAPDTNKSDARTRPRMHEKHKTSQTIETLTSSPVCG